MTASIAPCSGGRRTGPVAWIGWLIPVLLLSTGPDARADASSPRREGRLEQGTILARHAGGWITWQPFRPPGRRVRLKLDDAEAFRRVPLKFPVELAIAPDGRTARFIGILE